MKIGVARPADEQLAEVKHHFIASHSIFDEVNAAVFEKYALEKCSAIFQDHNDVVMVGGTGLYIKAFTDGMDDIPDIPEDIRENIIANYKKEGIAWLQEQLEQKDPLFAFRGEMRNPQRMMRALEVVESTGISILEHRTSKSKTRPFEIQITGLELPREQLYSNINNRVDEMMSRGLEKEARDLYPHRHLNALQTVGYRELFEYFDGKINLPEAVEEIKINTRQYAKRQLTWFRKMKGVNWLTASNFL